VKCEDLDGDGRDEILALTRDPGTLHVFESLDAEPRILPIVDWGLGPELIEVGGRTRAVVASQSTRELWLVALDGVGDQAAPPELDVLRVEIPGTPRVLATGDLGADGSLETCVATREGDLLMWSEGSTLLRVELEEGVPTCALVSPHAVLIGSQEAQSLRPYFLRPADSEGPARLEPGALIELEGIPRSLACARDGDMQRLVVVGGEHGGWHSPRIADGDWSTRLRAGLSLESFARLPAIPISVEPVDLDEDGVDEYSVLSFYGLRHVTIKTLPRPYEAHTMYAGQDPWDSALGDIDADGRLDLVVANRGASRLSVALGQGERSSKPKDGFEEAWRVAVSRAPHSLAHGDLDGDGTSEVISIGALGGRVDVVGMSPYGLNLRAPDHDAEPAGNCAAAGDLDDDGDADVAILVRDDGGARLRTWLGDGTGSLARLDIEHPLGRSAGDLETVTLSGGETAIMSADPEAGQIHLARLERAAGSGGEVARWLDLCTLDVPSAPTAIAQVSPSLFAIALGDPGPRTGVALVTLDLDAAAHAGLREVAHLEVPLLGIDICAADVLGSSEPELLYLAKAGRGDGPGRVVVFTQADGTWTQHGVLQTGLRPFALAAGDLDGDGKHDVVVGAQNSHHLNWWSGGLEALVRRQDIGVGLAPLDVLVADVTGDEKPDVVCACSASNDVVVARAR